MNDHGFLGCASLSHYSDQVPDTAVGVEHTIHRGVLTVISASVVQTSAQRRGRHIGNLHWNLFFSGGAARSVELLRHHLTGVEGGWCHNRSSVPLLPVQ